jgi:hypothetical protein
VKTFVAAIVLIGSTVAFAGNTITGQGGCWVADPGGKTAHWVKPCPTGALSKVASPTPAPTPKVTPKANQRSSDPMKGLNVSPAHGCWVANPPPNGNTATWVNPCPPV